MTKYILLIVTAITLLLACGEGGGDNGWAEVKLPPTVSIVEYSSKMREATVHSVRILADGNGSQIVDVTWDISINQDIEFSVIENNLYEFRTPRVDEDTSITMTVSVIDDNGLTASDSVNVMLLKNSPPELLGLEEAYSSPPLDQLIIRPNIHDKDGDKLTLEIKVLDGPITLKSGANSVPIVITTPEDSGSDQISTIKMTVSDGIDDVSSSFFVISPTSAIQVVSYGGEFDETDGLPLPILSDISIDVPSVSKLGVYKTKSGSFQIKLTSLSSAILTSEMEIQLFNQDSAINIKELFVYDSNSGLLFIPEEHIETFQSYLAEGINEVTISDYDTLDAQFAPTVSFRFGFADIQGQLVSIDGVPYKGLAGQELSLYSALSGLTYSTIIDNEGRYVFDGVPADTYNLALLTDELEIASESVLVTKFQDVYTIDPIVIKLGSTSTDKVKKAALKKHQNNPESSVSDRLSAHTSSINPTRAGSESLGYLIAKASSTAKAQGQAIIDTASVVIPDDVTSITIRTTVSTPEYPTYTTVNSQYNDSWHYTYSVGDTIQTKQGNVNSTHASIGTITSSETIDVSTMTGTSIHLYTRSTNIGDSALATTVTVEVFTDIEQFAINSFIHHEGLGAAGPLWYIGVGENTHRTWRAKVQFTPVDTVLSKAQCRYTVGTVDYDIASAILTSLSEGEAWLDMGFQNLSSFPTSPAHGNISCDFEGINADGAVMTSESATIMSLPGGKSSIIPLTRLNIPGRRYSGRDIGGDDWMTAAMRSYMMSNDFIYNDASREHGGCYVNDRFYAQYNKLGLACSKNIRDHGTHRDGKAVDVRYVIPFIRAADLQEYVKLAQNNANAEAIVVKWVTEARKNVTTVGNRDDVAKVIISMNHWLYDLLTQGVDANGNEIGNLGEWNNKPATVRKDSGHTQHFHIQMK